MSYQNTVDNIRGLVGGVDQTRSQELVDLATAYSGLCREANERLRRCADYLHRGLRTEAIHLAEAQPPLLDLVAALDMPELPDWENLCAMYDMPRPARLLMEAAEELNEAYAADQPLQSLLAEHRVLALCRAPLRDRIALMREIAEADPTGAFWDEDLRTFEQARLREIHAEATTAIRAGDANRITQLLSEVSTDDWRNPPTAELKQSLQRTSAATRRSDALRRLRELAPHLDVAYGAMSFEECAALLDDWNRVVQECQMTVPADLNERVAPVAQWVQEQKQRRFAEAQAAAAAHELSGAMDRHEPVDELRRLHQVACSFGVPTPDAIENRYKAELRAHDLAQRRRIRRNISVAVGGLVLVSVVIGWLTYRSIQERRIVSWQREMDELIKPNSLDNAQKRWTGIQQEAGSLTSDPRLQAASQRLHDAIQKEQSRAAELAGLMSQFNAKKIDEMQLSEVKHAEDLARTPSEKLAVFEWKSKVSELRHATQQERDAKFQPRLEHFVGSVTAIEQKLQSGHGETVADDVQKADQEAGDLAATAGISEPLLNSFQAIRKRLDVIRARAKQGVMENAALQRIAASDSSAKLMAALQEFVKAYPQSAHTVAFNQALELAPSWSAVEQWSNFSRSWNALAQSSAEEIDQRLAQLDQYQKAQPTSPLRASIEQYQKYLNQVKKCIANDGPYRGTLLATMNSPLVRDLKCIRQGDRVYYCRHDGNFDRSVVGVSFDAILTNDINKTVRRTLKGLPADAKPVESAQMKLSQTVVSKIRGLKPLDCDTFGLNVLKLIHDSAEMDPILQIILLSRGIGVCREAEFGFTPEMKDALEKLEGFNAEDMAWMNPEDDALAASRQQAVELIKMVPDPEPIRQQIISQREVLFASLRLNMQSVGVLLQQDQQPKLKMASPPAGPAVIMAVVRDSRTIEKVGELATTGAVFNDAVTKVPEGSMLFLCTAK